MRCVHSGQLSSLQADSKTHGTRTGQARRGRRKKTKRQKERKTETDRNDRNEQTQRTADQSHGILALPRSRLKQNQCELSRLDPASAGAVWHFEIPSRSHQI